MRSFIYILLIISAITNITLCKRPCNIRFAGGPQNFAMTGYYNPLKYTEIEIRKKGFFVGANMDKFYKATEYFFAYIHRRPCGKPGYFMKVKSGGVIGFESMGRKDFMEKIKAREKDCARCVARMGLN